MRYKSEIMNSIYIIYNEFKSKLSKNLQTSNKLSGEEIIVLLALSRLGGKVFISELTKEIGLSQSFVSKNITKLKNKDIIDIEVSKADRRERIITLKKLNEELKKLEEKSEKEVLNKLNDSEKEELKRLLIKAIGGIKE